MLHPAAGAQPPRGRRTIVTIPYAQGNCSASSTSTWARLESVPTWITASSDAIRSWCDRRFDQGTVIEEVPVELDGTIRLARPPINFIQRIQCRPRTALIVSNTTADTAWIYMATTGDLASGLTITGMVLNWEVAGVVNSATVLYSGLADQRISTLATAIGAVDPSWSATADPVLGDWPISEIMDGLASKGAGVNDQPNSDLLPCL